MRTDWYTPVIAAPGASHRTEAANGTLPRGGLGQGAARMHAMAGGVDVTGGPKGSPMGGGETVLAFSLRAVAPRLHPFRPALTANGVSHTT